MEGEGKVHNILTKKVLSCHGITLLNRATNRLHRTIQKLVFFLFCLFVFFGLTFEEAKLTFRLLLMRSITVSRYIFQNSNFRRDTILCNRLASPYNNVVLFGSQKYVSTLNYSIFPYILVTSDFTIHIKSISQSSNFRAITILHNGLFSLNGNDEFIPVSHNSFDKFLI